jgi:hypothetical protein
LFLHMSANVMFSCQTVFHRCFIGTRSFASMNCEVIDKEYLLVG